VADLLPILRDKTPQMLLCSVCPAPGFCCKNFRLNATFWNAGGPDDVTRQARDMGLPFIATHSDERDGPWCSKEDGDAEYSYWFFDCPELDTDGRCKIYDTRPEPCRFYQPGSDALCVFGNVETLE